MEHHQIRFLGTSSLFEAFGFDDAGQCLRVMFVHLAAPDLYKVFHEMLLLLKNSNHYFTITT